MAPDNGSRRIIRRWSDSECATGESKYLTADGTVWKTCWSCPPQSGVSYGQVDGNEMKPRKDDGEP